MKRKKQQKVIIDRNKNSVEQAKKRLRDDAENQMRTRIKQNDETYKKNEELLPRMIKQHDTKKHFIELNIKIHNAKLSGLGILHPTFEFETTETWKDLNRELILLEVEVLQDQLDNEITQLQNNIEKVKNQQERILKENTDLGHKLEHMDEYDFSGFEIPDEEPQQIYAS